MKPADMACGIGGRWEQAKEPSPAGRALVSQARSSGLWNPGSTDTGQYIS